MAIPGPPDARFETHPSTHWRVPWAVSLHCFTESPPTRCASSRFSMRSLLSATAGTENDRQRRCGAVAGIADRQPRAAVALRDPAQRDGAPAFKAWWTQFVPKPVERSTYVLFSSLALVLLFWQWRPLPAVLWHVDHRRSPWRSRRCRPGLADRAEQHVPDQPFRTVRPASGRQRPGRPADGGAAVSHAAVLQVRAAPDLSRLDHRVLGDAHHDRRATCSPR